MSLLTRTRRPTDRAGAVATDAIERAREAAGPAVERAREATGPAVERAREATGPAVERAREATAPAVDRAREASRPALAQLRSGVATVLRLVVRLAAIVPGVGARVLQGIATVMGRLADSTAEIAHVEPPSKVGRRRSRRRAGLWFAGGFVTGAAAGYVGHELMTRDHAHDREPGPEASWPPVSNRADGPSAQVAG